MCSGGTPSMCSLPCRDLGPEFDQAYSQSVHQTIRDELEDEGGDRQVAVKSFYLSRHLEVLSGVFGVSPKYVAQLAAEKHIYCQGVEHTQAVDVVSYALGVRSGGGMCDWLQGIVNGQSMLMRLSQCPVSSAILQDGSGLTPPAIRKTTLMYRLGRYSADD